MLKLNTKDLLMVNVYPLIDALSMPMRFYYRELKLTGSAQMELPLNSGAKKEVSLTLNPKVMASFVSKHEAAVLLKVRKRLWIFVHFTAATSVLRAYVIDAQTLNMHESSWGDGRLGKPISALAKMIGGVRAGFERHVTSDLWIRMENARIDLMDLGHQAELKQVDSDAAAKGAAT